MGSGWKGGSHARRDLHFLNMPPVPKKGKPRPLYQLYLGKGRMRNQAVGRPQKNGVRLLIAHVNIPQTVVVM